jgi:cobalt-zinc-cadmium efflux system membrane fusion protein
MTSSGKPLLALTVALALSATLLSAGCEEGGHDDHDDHSDHSDHGGDDGRPEGEASSDEVHLTETQYESAQIEVQKAGPGEVATYLTLTAIAEASLDTQAHVTPRVSGLVRAIHKHLGDSVKKGDLICEIDSVELGKVVNAYLSARTRLVASRALLAREDELLARSVEIAETVLARETKLKDKAITTLRPYYTAVQNLAQAKLSRDRRLLTLESVIKEREIALQTVRDHLVVLGRTPEEVASLAEDRKLSGLYQIRAPRDGIVVARDITVNEAVDTSSNLLRIVDMSRIWILASVYEHDLRLLRKGQAASVKLSAFPRAKLEGRVDFIGYQVDPETRACRVRVVLENKQIPGWKEEFPIRPGMFGTVQVAVARKQALVAVPEGAIVHESEESYLFVKEENEERAFVRRKVKLGARSASVVEVLEGVKAGESVAVRGTFILKSMARQGELGGGHSH